jgi:hypothetical protein
VLELFEGSAVKAAHSLVVEVDVPVLSTVVVTVLCGQCKHIDVVGE